MSIRTIVGLIFYSSSKHCRRRNVTLPRIALRYYPDPVTVILEATSLQTFACLQTSPISYICAAKELGDVSTQAIQQQQFILKGISIYIHDITYSLQK